MISADLLGNIVAWSLQAAVVAGAACVLPWLLRVDAAGVLLDALGGRAGGLDNRRRFDQFWHRPSS